MAKSGKRIIWSDARDVWHGTRGGVPLCRIRRSPKRDVWMLLRCIHGDNVAEWQSDHATLDEAKLAAAELNRTTSTRDGRPDRT